MEKIKVKAGARVKGAAVTEKKNLGTTIGDQAAKSAGVSGKSIVGNLFLSGDGYTVKDVTVTGTLTVSGKNITLENVQVKAAATLTLGKTDITLKNVQVASAATAVIVEEKAEGTVFRDCRMTGDVAVNNKANGTTLLGCVMSAKSLAVADSAKSALTLRDCRVTSKGEGILSSSADLSVMFCDFKTAGTAVALTGGKNQIVAYSVFAGKGACVSLSGVKNTVVLKNRLAKITALRNRNIYVVGNEADVIDLENNNYLLADLNKYKKNLSKNNANQNGDTVTDVKARLPYGADERLLPHTDKELFVGMERKATVYDPADSGKTIGAYISSHAEKEDVVIVPPGAYAEEENILLIDKHSNTQIYAFGVYAERQNDIGNHIAVMGAFDITISGLTVAYSRPSCLQSYVVEKVDKNTVRLLSGAGLIDEFINSNPAYCSIGWFSAEHHGDGYPYRDLWYNAFKGEKEEDGTRLLTMRDDMTGLTRVGDIMTCRYSGGDKPMKIHGSGRIQFRDMTLYGVANDFAVHEYDNRDEIFYFRLANTTRNGEIIDEATYRRYEELEKKYGISFDISIDEEGRYRGSAPRIGSVDATHTTMNRIGSRAESCLFENMCDDGTNQHHFHARLHDFHDNGDGTTTLIYKGNLCSWAYGQGVRVAGTACVPFAIGERVYIYTADGQMVCDTRALTATEVRERITAEELGGTEVQTYAVQVATAAVNFAALKNFDLHSNSWEDKTKVPVDNMDHASNGFHFDNVMVRNIRSRGLLIKSSNASVCHCTFRDVGMSCIAVLYEMCWGESGITENLTVDSNLMDHTGFFPESVGDWPPQYFFRQPDLYAPISIYGLGSSADEKYLLYKNIRITNNKVMNRTQGGAAVYINSAKNVQIVGNDFGTDRRGKDSVKEAVHLKGAANIQIADNLYPDPTAKVEEIFALEHIKNVYGKDTETYGTLYFADKV